MTDSVMRVSGVCSTCRQPAFYLVAVGTGRIEDSERHFDANHDEQHKATPSAGPLKSVVGDYLAREARP